MARSNTPATDQEVGTAAEIGPVLEAWYGGHGRSLVWRRWRDPFRLTVTEILLQRTSAEVVSRFIEGFLAAYPHWRALAQADRSQLEAALKPLGLQRRRADVLVRLAGAMVATDRLDPFPAGPGVGQYVGRAVRVGTVGEAVAMVDSNFTRVIRRFFGGHWMSDYRYDRRLQAIALGIVKGARDPRRVNWAVLDLGAAVCRPREPLCRLCPLANACRYAARL